MSNPWTARVTTYAPSVQVASADLNQIQDNCIALAAQVHGALSIPPIALKAQDGANQQYVDNSFGAFRSVSRSGGGAPGNIVLEAELNLPQGMDLVDLDVWGYLNVGTASITAYLYREELATGVETQIGTTITLTGGTGILTGNSDLTGTTVNNGAYAYFLRVGLADTVAVHDARFISARIK